MFEEVEQYNLSEAADLLNSVKFHNDLPTVFYIQGYAEPFLSGHLKQMVDSYISRGDHNIIALNWEIIANENYVFQLFPKLGVMSLYLATFIKNMIENGLNLQTLHIVGHSIGAQMASLASRRLSTSTKGHLKLRRITGLDPALPLFYPGVVYGHISKADANLVDIIHSDAGIYGARESTGTIDFWPNEGTTLQPGCPPRDGVIGSITESCSHNRALDYFAESVSSKKQHSFLAIKCSSWNDFKSEKCNQSDIVRMGFDCSLSAFGNYYLITSDVAPFSKDSHGIYYKNQRFQWYFLPTPYTEIFN